MKPVRRSFRAGTTTSNVDDWEPGQHTQAIATYVGVKRPNGGGRRLGAACCVRFPRRWSDGVMDRASRVASCWRGHGDPWGVGVDKHTHPMHLRWREHTGDGAGVSLSRHARSTVCIVSWNITRLDNNKNKHSTVVSANSTNLCPAHAYAPLRVSTAGYRAG